MYVVMLLLLYYQVEYSISGTFRNKLLLLIYWIVWFVMLAFWIISHKFNMPWLFNLCQHIMIVRNIIPVFNFEEREQLKDLAEALKFSHFKQVGLIVGFFVPICLVNRARLHIPVSIVYQGALCYGILVMFYA